jgi:hypothetical protein
MTRLLEYQLFLCFPLAPQPATILGQNRDKIEQTRLFVHLLSM